MVILPVKESHVRGQFNPELPVLCVGIEGGLTTRKYVSLANVSRATAFRELDQLLEFGLIKRNPARGRSASYDLNWPEDG